MSATEILLEEMRDLRQHTNRELSEIRKQCRCIERELVKLKANSGLWGAISGSVTVIAALLFNYFRTKV